eukprot:RCo017544
MGLPFWAVPAQHVRQHCRIRLLPRGLGGVLGHPAHVEHAVLGVDVHGAGVVPGKLEAVQLLAVLAPCEDPAVLRSADDELPAGVVCQAEDHRAVALVRAVRHQLLPSSEGTACGGALPVHVLLDVRNVVLVHRVRNAVQGLPKVSEHGGVALVGEDVQAKLHRLAQHGQRGAAVLLLLQQGVDRGGRPFDRHELQLDQGGEGLGVREELRAHAVRGALQGEELQDLLDQHVAGLRLVGLRDPRDEVDVRCHGLLLPHQVSLQHDRGEGVEEVRQHLLRALGLEGSLNRRGGLLELLVVLILDGRDQLSEPRHPLQHPAHGVPREQPRDPSGDHPAQAH